MGYRSTIKRNKGRRQESKRYTVGELEAMPLLYPDLAGIDIGSREHYVSVAGDRSEHPVRTFGCTTPDLLEMANWLKLCGITHVVMESTGVYWVPVAMMLEDAGLKVALVDARESHRLSARKTDVHDCQWIRQLYACGLLRNAFRPAAQILLLRSYWRQPQELVSMCATSLHHMQKALELMNVQLHKVISDIAGLTGMRILRAIAGGQSDPQSFVHMIHPNCKCSSAQMVNALTGHYAPEQVFALGQALRRYDLYQQQIAQLDRELHGSLGELPPRQNSEPEVATAGPKSPDGKRRKNQSHFDLAGEVHRITGVDLTRIEGIDALTAFTVITEQGIDMSHFPTEKHFASHLGLCPNNQITGGRVRKKRTRRVQSRAAHALRLAAQSLARSKTALGAFYRRMKARHGAAKANVATAHKLAKIFYRMLRHGEQYVARGQEDYEKRYRERLLKNLKRQAKILGCEVLVLETGEVLS
jgi:transposase